MKPEKFSALSSALRGAAPDDWDELERQNHEAIRDYDKFGSITDLADQLDRGGIVDPDLLRVAASALRRLSEGTEQAALNRKARWERDMEITQSVKPLWEDLSNPVQGSVESRADKAAPVYGLNDRRSVFKVMSKFMAQFGNDKKRY